MLAFNFARESWTQDRGNERISGNQFAVVVLSISRILLSDL